nr:DUF4125 family protein [uncultured Pseudodesulfovibrio sp.]
MSKNTRTNLIKEIINLELDMFLAVKNQGGTSMCQERPESFRIMREITHRVLSDEFLQSYRNDLQHAEKKGRNFMTEKYALMDQLIPSISTDPRIKKIVAIESAWRKDVAKEFPHTIHPDGHESFCLYLGCELETYSTSTMDAYEICVQNAQKEKMNLVQERYELLMVKLGHGSLRNCEANLIAQHSHTTGKSFDA